MNTQPTARSAGSPERSVAASAAWDGFADAASAPGLVLWLAEPDDDEEEEDEFG